MKRLHAQAYLGVLFLVIAVSTWLAYSYAQNQQAANAALESQRLKLFKLALEDTMQTYRDTANALGQLVQENPDIDQAGFAAAAEHIYYNHHEIRSMELARNSVISHVYPLQTNEAAIGMDLTQLENARADVLHTLKSQTPTLSKPITLLQGGRALVLREPVKLNGQPWGLAILAIDWQKLQHNSGFDLLRENNAQLAIRVRELNGQWQTIQGETGLFTAPDALVSSLEMPGREWQIAIERKPLMTLLASNDILVLAVLLTCILGSFWLIFALPSARRFTNAASFGSILLCSSAFLLAQSQSSEEHQLIETLHAGEQVRDNLHASLMQDRAHLKRFVSQLAAEPVSRGRFVPHAQQMLAGQPGMSSLSWVNPQLRVEYTAGVPVLNPTVSQPLARQAAQLLQETRLPAYSDVFISAEGSQIFQLWYPVYTANKLQGMLVASYPVEQLLTYNTPAQLQNEYSFSTLHNPGVPGDGLRQQNKVQMVLTPPGNGLNLVISRTDS